MYDVQAARVTRVCQLLKDAAVEIRSRPQLYADTPQLDLDSVLLLTQAITLRVSHMYRNCTITP